MALINLKEVFQRAFKVAPRYLIPNYSDLESLPSHYDAFDLWTEEPTADISPLGTPILEQIVIKKGAYKGFEIVNGLPKQIDITYSAYTFPGWAMIDVSQNKVIVKTPINGRHGTIKEYIYKDDYKVTIRGIIATDGIHYPYKEKMELQSLYNVNASIEIVSRTLNDLGVRDIVMESLDFSDVEGMNNLCTFSINAVSDKGVLLEIKEIGK